MHKQKMQFAGGPGSAAVISQRCSVITSVKFCVAPKFTFNRNKNGDLLTKVTGISPSIPDVHYQVRCLLLLLLAPIYFFLLY
jgi:hypothetical protein